MPRLLDTQTAPSKPMMQLHAADDRAVRAEDALELARAMPPGPARNEALKIASLLRCAADKRGAVIFARRGRPPK